MSVSYQKLVAERKKREKLELPEARLFHENQSGAVIISADPGDMWIRVGYCGTPFVPAHRHSDTWSDCGIKIGESTLTEVAGLIHALTARYNRIVRELNQVSGEIPPMREIDEVTP